MRSSAFICRRFGSICSTNSDGELCRTNDRAPLQRAARLHWQEAGSDSELRGEVVSSSQTATSGVGRPFAGGGGAAHSPAVVPPTGAAERPRLPQRAPLPREWNAPESALCLCRWFLSESRVTGHTYMAVHLSQPTLLKELGWETLCRNVDPSHPPKPSHRHPDSITVSPLDSRFVLLVCWVVGGTLSVLRQGDEQKFTLQAQVRFLFFFVRCTL